METTSPKTDTKQKPGRKLKGSERMTTIAFRMEPDDVSRLDQIANRIGEGRSVVIRKACQLFFDRNINHVDNSEVA